MADSACIEILSLQKGAQLETPRQDAGESDWDSFGSLGHLSILEPMSIL